MSGPQWGRRCILGRLARAPHTGVAPIGVGGLPTGGIMVRLRRGAGGTGGNRPAARGHASLVQRIRGVARNLVVFSEQGRTVAAPEPARFAARPLSRGTPASP